MIFRFPFVFVMNLRNMLCIVKIFYLISVELISDDFFFASSFDELEDYLSIVYSKKVKTLSR